MKPGDLTVIEAYRQIWKSEVIRDRAGDTVPDSDDRATASRRWIDRPLVLFISEARRGALLRASAGERER